MIVSFSPSHLREMAPTPDAAAVIEMPGVAEALERTGSKTLLSPAGEVLGVIGFVPLVPGVCEVFILATHTQRRYPVAFARAVRAELFTLKNKYRRIQSIAKCEQFYFRWLTWLGFKPEGIMSKYGPNGEDMALWALV